MGYYIHIIETETDRVEKVLGPYSERKADRIDDAMQHKIDHDNYHTEIKDKGRD